VADGGEGLRERRARGSIPKINLSNQQTSDLAGRGVIPSLNNRALEELKGVRGPGR